MKEIKILATVFFLSIVLDVFFYFCLSLFETSGASFNGTQSSGPDPLILKFIFSCILGGVHGAVIGTFSVIFLIATLVFKNQMSAPIWLVSVYSVLVGILLALFYFNLLSGQFQNYALALKSTFNELARFFIFGFLTALLPIIAAKKYLDF